MTPPSGDNIGVLDYHLKEVKEPPKGALVCTRTFFSSIL